MAKKNYVVKAELPSDKAAPLRDKKIVDFIRRSSEEEVRLTNPTKFFKKISQPVESRAWRWLEDLKNTTEEQLDTNGISKIVEVDPSGKWRWRVIRNTEEMKKAIKQSEENQKNYVRMREQRLSNFVKAREDQFGGSGFADGQDGLYQQASFPTRPEYSPLISSPFFKQMYLYDYWEMHSRLFWYSNYSGIAKMIIDMTTNFVMGKGFTVQFKDEKAQDAWKAYEERSNIQEIARTWCSEFTKFGENFIQRTPSKNGIIHRSKDPSTFWEIITDPEDILDVKYYHQQYNTQYQLYATKDAPISKYVINQIPPELMIHERVNVTPYEKRGRSDLLGALLYFKYFEDYMTASLLRAKNEAAFIWDVTVKGSDDDVQAYISQTQSIVDVPPGSENVHNEAVERKPLSPQLTTRGADQTSQSILSYIAMAVSIPTSYFGVMGSTGATRAGALVTTEPVGKKMLERQMKMEYLLRKIVKDVLLDAGLDVNTPFEITFPEIQEEDRAQKIQDIITAKEANAFSHRRMSEMIAKELRVSDYDYDAEKKEIENEAATEMPMPDLTQPADGEDNQTRALDRSEVRDEGTSW